MIKHEKLAMSAIIFIGIIVGMIVTLLLCVTLVGLFQFLVWLV